MVNFRDDLDHVLATLHNLSEAARIWEASPHHVDGGNSNMNVVQICDDLKHDVVSMGECWQEALVSMREAVRRRVSPTRRRRRRLVLDDDDDDDDVSCGTNHAFGPCDEHVRRVQEYASVFMETLRLRGQDDANADQSRDGRYTRIRHSARKLFKCVQTTEAMCYEAAREAGVDMRATEASDDDSDSESDDESSVDSDDERFIASDSESSESGSESNDDTCEERQSRSVEFDDELLLGSLEDESARQSQTFATMDVLPFVEAARQGRATFLRALQYARDATSIVESTEDYVRSAAIHYDAIMLALDENASGTHTHVRHDVFSTLVDVLVGRRSLRAYATFMIRQVTRAGDDFDEQVSAIEDMERDLTSRAWKRYRRATGSSEQPTRVDLTVDDDDDDD